MCASEVHPFKVQRSRFNVQGSFGSRFSVRGLEFEVLKFRVLRAPVLNPER